MWLMLHRKRMGWLAACMAALLLLAGGAQGQGPAPTCPAFVEEALTAVSSACASLGRNQVCFGHDSIEAEFQQSIPFAQPGDLANVADLRRLATAPLQPQAGTWGVAMLAVQANLPDSLPGQNATFIVFGDAEMTPQASDTHRAPMQAFRLETNITGLECDDVPESGMLVQAPADTEINLQINDVEVKVGSSALLQIEGGDLNVDTIEGYVQVTAAGTSEVAGEGVSVRVPRGGQPVRAALTRARRVSRAPWRLLPRPVAALPPVPDGQQVTLNDCLTPANRAGRTPITLAAEPNAPIVLNFSVPFANLALARLIRDNVQNRLTIDDQAAPPLTRVGPWRGPDAAPGSPLLLELYWLIPPQAPGTLIRLELNSRTVTGQPIDTGYDGPDRDRQPEIIPAQRRITCQIRVEDA